MKRRWLKDWPSPTVITINEGLCRQKKALHKPTDEGYEVARRTWEVARRAELTLRDALRVCRRCHQLSPFCFYNGNTFVAIGRVMIEGLLRSMTPAKAHAFRSVVGHFIAGTAGEDELDQALAEIE
jgi:hypothetical protein